MSCSFNRPGSTLPGQCATQQTLCNLSHEGLPDQAAAERAAIAEGWRGAEEKAREAPFVDTLLTVRKHLNAADEQLAAATSEIYVGAFPLGFCFFVLLFTHASGLEKGHGSQGAAAYKRVHALEGCGARLIQSGGLRCLPAAAEILMMRLVQRLL